MSLVWLGSNLRSFSNFKKYKIMGDNPNRSHQRWASPTIASSDTILVALRPTTLSSSTTQLRWNYRNIQWTQLFSRPFVIMWRYDESKFFDSFKILNKNFGWLYLVILLQQHIISYWSYILTFTRFNVLNYIKFTTTLSTTLKKIDISQSD